MHCGNFASIEEAKKHKNKCIKDVNPNIGEIHIRKRTTSIDKEKLPYEVVILYK